MEKKKRFVAVGTGGRISMFIDPIARDYRDAAELTAFCDLSEKRMAFHRDRLVEDYGYHAVRTYPVADFDRMVREEKPDTVIVCTMDSTHHEYIVRSLDLGCDVICEKPMTVDEEKCRQIMEAVERSGKNVRITFNYRWSPGVTRIREIVQSGRIGAIKHVHMEYLLNTKHGADYFRRWHATKACSGGLLVHKSTHHFDLINWWINSIPSKVYAQGGLVYYGRENAIARGDEALTRYDRYTGKAPQDDPFRLDLAASPRTKALYLDAEEETGYLRDRNVFRDDIDIEDTMSLLVTYRNGINLNYSLNAYCPWEGFRVAINGDKGRLEFEEIHASHLITGQSDEELAEEQENEKADSYRIRVLPLFGKEEWIEVPKTKGGHGGGDPMLQSQMFAANPVEETLGRNAGHEQGAASILIGIAGNHSMKSGQPVLLDDLVKLRPGAVRLDELV